MSAWTLAKDDTRKESQNTPQIQRILRDNDPHRYIYAGKDAMDNQLAMEELEEDEDMFDLQEEIALLLKKEREIDLLRAILKEM